MDVAEWLTGLGLGQYATPFDAENVDLSVVPTLSDQDLKDLGVATIGHRRKMGTEAVSMWRNCGPAWIAKLRRAVFALAPSETLPHSGGGPSTPAVASHQQSQPSVTVLTSANHERFGEAVEPGEFAFEGFGERAAQVPIVAIVSF